MAASATAPRPAEIVVAADGPGLHGVLDSLAGMTSVDRVDLIQAAADLDGGLRAVVEVRHRVMPLLGAEPGLHPVESSLRAALEDRFATRALEFRRIEADSPDELLDRLTEYEAVHPIRSRSDLLRRLDPVDRRCFGLFHPDLGGDPLVFVEVALTSGLALSVQAILDAGPPAGAAADADTAVFYSITNCQPGLRGVPFGAELLHRAMDHLTATTPVRTLATLSPIPGFARWLGDRPSTTDALLTSCARYLLTAKRGNEPLDPVARFHLGNGARLERLNPDGDTSEHGLARHFGVAANYLYDHDHLAQNQAAYRQGRIVASDTVRSRLERP
jgi:malonyl-CoA decarboxylase